MGNKNHESIVNPVDFLDYETIHVQELYDDVSWRIVKKGRSVAKITMNGDTITRYSCVERGAVATYVLENGRYKKFDKDVVGTMLDTMSIKRFMRGRHGQKDTQTTEKRP